MPPPLSRQYLSPVGRLSVDVVSSRVIETTMSGVLDLTLARYFLEGLDAWVRLGGAQLVAFHDWEGVTDYESEARTLLTPWSKTHRPKFDNVHMLVHGRALAWGIKLVNAVTGDVMTVHHERGTFAEARRNGGRRTG